MSYSLAHSLYALCSDTRDAERVETDMGRMMELHEVAPADLRDDPHRWLEAKTRCAACAGVDRCHSYLAGGIDDPSEFCGNSAAFTALKVAS